MNKYEKALREFADDCLKDETQMKSEVKEWIFGAALFCAKTGLIDWGTENKLIREYGIIEQEEDDED